MITSELIQHSLVYGAFLSGVMVVFILGSLAANAELWLNDYPPDVRAKYGQASPRTLRQRKWISILFLVLLVGIMAASLWDVPHLSGGGLGFLPAATHLFIVFMTFNLVDLLVIDYLIAMTLRPRFFILPGTEGMPGYNDYGFHLRAFLAGTVMGLVASLVLGGIASGIYTLAF